jgi:hypothetical protein
VTTDTASGTTTYFGGGAKEAAQPQVVAKPQPPPKPTLTASIDLSNQKMVVTVNGEARYSWAISSGVAEYPTPTGTFHPQWTAKMWYSRKYDMAPMPNAVFINGGVAVHGTYHVRSLGYAASHGCIRLSPGHAKTFYDLVQRHGLKRTKVTVFGRPHWRGPAVASRSANQAQYAYNQGADSGEIAGAEIRARPMRRRSRRKKTATALTTMTPMACRGRSIAARTAITFTRDARRGLTAVMGTLTADRARTGKDAVRTKWI